MKILVTGFDPFDNDKINPAIEAVKLLPDSIAGAEIIKLEIPTKFNVSAEVVKTAIEKYQPDYVLNIGQAGGRFAITPERIAINLDDGRIADNAGYQPLNATIHEDGATAYFTQLPIKAMTRAIRAAGLPAAVSNTAGTYVCNHIFYQVQYMREKFFPNIKAGFIHIPFLPNQVVARPETPALSLEDDVKGLTAAIRAIVERDSKGDIETVEGTIQ
ncbi:pyroglutamyl-peptidase I [Lactobacillus jensenii]|jgi:pyroglutamyl-peptidase I|uniref:Pyrrolidone-carboxylate peptidase n=1 Tax=Lactobacillus jensenii TaxID=109790 RepID=A0A5N1I5A2_LACJE|nr:pyroglutamyl-peptidase I [Lactobacillus jensenii]EEQ69078.1 pyroglutamyl-peptidase I [Lactobacillus jensenii 1153]ERJ43540.1 pyrrolidone-carboxylate peptidase [Lactobacillus jensenii MD IIE-70(2)]APT14831.1 pyroglutamyl-peptidase I [Lactobacillus jensenii]EEQ24523.1 pyroglutamyl-peptidase I [Lactobacillus jensenii 269-3]EEX27544.1 pyroglutamyl-peptidase I [Lactobacillus jensenii SJ-7A-US]